MLDPCAAGELKILPGVLFLLPLCICETREAKLSSVLLKLTADHIYAARCILCGSKDDITA